MKGQFKKKKSQKKRRREYQTARVYVGVTKVPCWVQRGDGVQSVHCGHGWTTQPLHKSLFLKHRKETVRFTVTRSRLYSVNVKLH